MASRSAAFEEALGCIHPDWHEWLKLKKMLERHVLGFMFGDEPGSTIPAKGRGSLQALGARGNNDAWAGQLFFFV